MSGSVEKLQSRILTDARVKAENIINEADEKARKIVEEATTSAQKEAGAYMARARVEADALRRSILSIKVRANRLRLLDEKNRIVQSVLSEVETRLSTIPGTEQFQDILKRFVNEAVDAVGSDQVIVKVGFREASKTDLDVVGRMLPKGSKVIVEETPIDDLGGVVASDSQGRIVFNNSFKARLDRLENGLLTLISSSIFGE